jgi:hypothetical protein
VDNRGCDISVSISAEKQEIKEAFQFTRSEKETLETLPDENPQPRATATWADLTIAANTRLYLTNSNQMSGWFKTCSMCYVSISFRFNGTYRTFSRGFLKLVYGDQYIVTVGDTSYALGCEGCQMQITPGGVDYEDGGFIPWVLNPSSSSMPLTNISLTYTPT